jgi:[ribosomal protein S18]-alanine N-acetyltransferase
VFAQHVHLRWLLRRDLPEVLAIEQASFPTPWTEAHFASLLRRQNCVGTVAEVDDGRIAGFMLYELSDRQIRLLNLAVAPDDRRRGLGSQLIWRLLTKLSNSHRRWLTLTVRETNLPAQLFFRRLGLRAVRIERNSYADTPEDAYVFRISADRVRALGNPVAGGKSEAACATMQPHT